MFKETTTFKEITLESLKKIALVEPGTFGNGEYAEKFSEETGKGTKSKKLSSIWDDKIFDEASRII